MEADNWIGISAGRENKVTEKVVKTVLSAAGDSSGIIEDGVNFLEDARLEIIEKIEIKGEYACFDCGYGHLCQVGGLKNFYELPVEPEEVERPRLAQEKLKARIDRAGIREVCAQIREAEFESCK
ncbi:MAG: hypothetical protein ACLFUK_00730 [Halanaerobium sp.]